jgi:hypothetical protein
MSHPSYAIPSKTSEKFKSKSPGAKTMRSTDLYAKHVEIG